MSSWPTSDSRLPSGHRRHFTNIRTSRAVFIEDVDGQVDREPRLVRSVKAKRAVATGRPVREAVVRVSRSSDDRRDWREAIVLPNIKTVLISVVAIEVGEILTRPLKYVSDRREPRVADEVILLHELAVDPPRWAVGDSIRARRRNGDLEFEGHCFGAGLPHTWKNCARRDYGR